ncbi:MAG: hypothetical protein ACYS1A_12790 [Planctomycetota bacterium]|jgi:hypothetical protein
MDDDFDISDIPMPQKSDKPTSFDDEKPIPFEDAGDTGVSHAPLTLGGDSAVGTPKIEVPKPIAKKPTEKIVSSDRITGVKTFFTKLHAGSIDFLNGQIRDWLKQNPGVVIKRTNAVTGLVASKKTEPNLIITVWY